MAAVLAVAVSLCASTSGVSAWGFDPHRSITARAIDGLPSPLREFFAPYRGFVSEHSIDPDLWRVVDLRGTRGAEDQNHFFNIDNLDESPPFAGIPRDWDALVKRYGARRANAAGRLPWRAAEIGSRLSDAFRRAGRGDRRAGDDARFLSAVLAHYIEDAYVPFHAVANYDGQQTGQRGIHARFETDLVARYAGAMTLDPVRVRPVPNVVDFVFAALVEGEALTHQILDADRAADPRIGDDAYYERMWTRLRPLVERRLSEAASATASAITAAWQAGGRPPLGVTSRGGARRP